MKTEEPKYAKLLEYKRNGLVEQVHYGVLVHMNKNGVIKKIGEDNNYKFFHRSCMKPLQVSVLFDLDLDKKLNLSLEEIAVCSASHTGDIVHREKVLSVLNKIGCTADNLLCAPHMPLSEVEKKRLFENHLDFDKLHNNCSGKHSLMLALCKEMGYSIENYTDINHPLSSLVLNKVCGLCEVNIDDVVISKDGCTLPVIATSLEALGKGFLNLFTSEKYKKLTRAFLKFPYLIGGNFRLDSEIINASDNLVAKVGACGLCVVVNLDKEECIIVKIADSDMEARTFVVIKALLQKKWLDINRVNSNQIRQIYIKEIFSQDNDVLGMKIPSFNIDS